MELDTGTMNIESGACDLPPEGSKKRVIESKINRRSIAGMRLLVCKVKSAGCFLGGVVP